MLELLQYPFFRNALLGVLLLSIGAGIIGTYVVSRRMVSICGGVTHASFGGLGLGYFMGWSPLATAAVFAVASSLSVEWMSWSGRVRRDSAIAVVWALGMAVGVFFVFLTPGAVPELNSFLFGNVLTITAADLWMLGAYASTLVLLMLFGMDRIVAVAFDPDFAAVQGLPVKRISLVMTVLVAVGIVLMIRCVGIMLLMSMLTLPQLTAEVFSRRYRTLVPLSVGVSVAGCMAGLLATVSIDVPPAALIVFMQVALYSLARVYNSLRKSI